MAKNAPEVASLDPGEMLQGGLPDDFRGKIVAATYCAWDYDGKIDEPVLGAQLTIEREDDTPVTQVWSAGDLKSFVPSEDGKSPCDLEAGETGPYAIRVGKRAQLNNNTNFSHLMSSIIDSGEAAKGKPFTRANLTASLECLVGLDAHWNRVPQKKRSGLQTEEGEEGTRRRSNDVLVVTEVYGYGEAEAPAKGKKGASTKAAPAPPAKKGKPAPEPEPEEEDTEEAADTTDDDDLQSLVLEALGENGNSVKKSKLVGAIVKLAGKDPRKAKFIKRVTEPEFLEDTDRPWSYDEDSGSISL